MDFPPAYRRISPADARKNEPQEIVNLRRGSDRRTGVAGSYFLLYCNRRRNAVDKVHIRLAHPPEELPGIGREALAEAPLPLGIKSVKNERRLAGPGNSGDHDKFSSRYLKSQVFEIVDSCSFYKYIIAHFAGSPGLLLAQTQEL